MARKKETEAQTHARILLTLWDMGGQATWSKLRPRIVRSGETTSTYTKILTRLEEVGAIAVEGKRGKKYALVEPEGLQLLRESLRDPGWKYPSQIGAKTANALLKWIREMGYVPMAEVAEAIGSYDDFQSVALEVYERLDQEHNFDGLVPIYRIRREIDGRVNRSQFNEWLLKMQENGIFQLQGGSLPDQDPQKIEDSITTELSGLRCYAKLLVVL